MFASLVVVLCALLAVYAHADMSAGGPTWSEGGMQKVTSLIGVYSPSPAEVYGAVLDNSLGNGVAYSDDYAASGQFFGPAGAMNMDVAFTKDGSTGCLAGIGGLFIGSPKSASYTKVPGLRSITQNVEFFSTQGFAAAGQFVYDRTSVNGLAVSTDAGATWKVFDIGMNSTYYPARYTALPSESTWYVSSGSWPYDEVSSDQRKRLTSKITIHERGMIFADRIVGDSSGYTGAISRTTDGGKTWTQVFDSKGSFYMNGISCADETHCVAVGEGDDGAFAVGTTDGVNWNTILTTELGLSLVAAKMISPTEAWVAGGGQVKRQLTGYYYHTTDGGATWELTTLPGYVMDLSFSSSTSGYAAFATQSYGGVAVYH